MRIDIATIDDVPRLAELLGILFEQEEEFTPDRAAAIVRTLLAQRHIPTRGEGSA